MRQSYQFVFLLSIGFMIGLSFFNEAQAQLIVQDSFFSECRRSVQFRVSGGTLPYTYQWFYEGDLVQSDENVDGLTISTLTQAKAGEYSVIVTDNNGLTLTRSFNFMGVSNFTLDVNIIDLQQCGVESIGVVTGNIEGGLAPYTVRFFDELDQIVRTINNFPGGPLNLNGIPAGKYLVEVEDSNQCIELTEIEIPEIDPIVLTPGDGVGTFPETCVENGGIFYNATGFEGEVRFRIRRANGTYVNTWTVAPGGEIMYNQLAAGNYVLEIIDLYRFEDCPAELPFSIGNEILLEYIPSSTPVVCFGETNGTITLEVNRLFMGFPFPPATVSVDIIRPNGSTAISNQTINIGTTSGSRTFSGFGPGLHTIVIRHGGGDYPECTQTTTVNVTAPPAPLTASVATTSETCFGDNNGTARVNRNGGWGGYTYLWSTGATTRTVTGLAPGNYTVRVSDSEGCFIDLNVEIQGPSAPITGDIELLKGLTCVGSNDGSARINNLTGGWGGFTYLWSNGETTATAFNLPAGTNTLTVRDSEGCEEVYTVNVPVPDSPVVTSTPVSPSCFGGSDGSIRIQIGDPSTAFTVITNGESKSGNDVTFENLPAGTYTVQISYDGGICNITEVVTVSNPPQIIIDENNLDIKHLLCHGDGNGQITGIAVSGGTGTLTYQWQQLQSGTFVDLPGQTNLSLLNLSGGTYKLLVRDSNNCILEREYIVNEQGPLEVSDPIVTDVGCFGEQSGSVSFTISGGTLPYTYTFNGGTPVTTSLENVTINGIGAGTNYFVEIRDANGCAIPNINFDVNSAPAITVSNIQVIQETCSGQNNGSISVDISGGSGNLGVEWYAAGNFSTILSTDQTLTNRGAGDYTIKVFDKADNNCFIIRTITIPPTDDLNLALDGPPIPVLCFGEETGAIKILVSGGTGDYTFAWTGPNGFTSNTQNIENLAAGLYNVRVTDENGCWKELTDILIDQPASGILINVLNKIEPKCADSSDGRIEIQVAGGNPTYGISWSKENSFGGFDPIPGTSLTLSNITSGNYKVRVIDSNGCIREEIIDLNAPDPLQINIINIENVTCFGRNDGKIFIEVTGGTGVYSFSWDHGFINQNPTNLGAGSYSVTVRDANNCEVRLENIIVEEPAPLQIDLVNLTPPTCLFNDGSIEVSYSGAIAGLESNRWINLQTNEVFAENTNLVTGLTPGFYRVEYSSGASCTVTRTFNVPGPASPLRILASTQDASCPGETGVLSLSATGGRPAYTFTILVGGIWQEVNSTIISSLTQGTYEVKVTDAVGCEDLTTITIDEPNPPMFNIEVEKHVSCFGLDDGKIKFSLFGNTSNISVQWYRRNPFGGVIPIQTADLDNLIAGVYFLELTYASGCTKTSDDYEITQPAEIITTETLVQPICVDDFGSFSLSVTGGVPGKNIHLTSTNGYSLSYNDEHTGTFQFNNLPSGLYTWTVEDTGCQEISGQFTVISILKPDFEVITQDISCFGENDGIINIINPQVQPGRTFTVLINGVSQGNQTTFTNLAAGNYQIRIMDNMGCMSDPVNVTLVQPDRPLEIIQFDKIDISCFGESTGSIRFEIRGGRPDYRAVLTNTNGYSASLTNLQSETSYEFENLPIGNYTLEVYDQNNVCETQRVFEIVQPSPLQVSHTFGEIQCVDDLTFIDLTVTGATQPYTYFWEKFDSNLGTWENIPFNGKTLSNIPAGTYRYSVTGANNCTSITETVVINEAPPFILNYNVDDILCFGGSTMLTLQAQLGSATNFSYFVNGSQIFGNQFLATAGTYTIYAVNNSRGCRSEDIIVTINQPDAPLEVQQFDVENLSCFEANNGSISFALTGGTAPYTISFQGMNYSANDGELLTFDNLAANITYDFSAVDANGCTVRIPSATLSQPFPLLVNTTFTAISCPDDRAQINLQVSGGTRPYLIRWEFASDGINFSPKPEFDDATVISNLTGGYYRYTVTDGGCDDVVETIHIIQPERLEISSEIQDISCFGESSGAIKLTITGGTGNYRIQWSNGMTGTEISGLRAGDYTVFVIDENSCIISETFQINQPSEALKVEGIISSELCKIDDEIEVSLNVQGGTAPYTFLWSNGATSQNIVGIGPGNYTVTVTDAQGCTTNASFDVPPPSSPMTIDFVGKLGLCTQGERGEIRATVSGGAAPYTYLWSNGATTSTISNLTAGAYTLTVTDANGCTTSKTIEISGAQNWRLNLDALTNVTCFGAQDGSIQLSIIGGREPFKIRWSHGLEDELFAGNLAPGVYTVNIQDEFGCEINATYSIREPQLLTYTEIVEDSKCYGNNNGSISINVTGGTPPYRYQWSNGANSRNIRNLGPGEYSLVITDRNGCSTGGVFYVAEPELLEIESDHSEMLLCHGDNDGYINLNVIGGIQPYRVIWNDEPDNESYNRSNLTAGEYKVTVIDDNGCITEKTFIIQEPAQLEVSLMTAFDVDCEARDLKGIAWINITGGTGEYKIFWNNGITDAHEIIFLEDSDISVMVMDDNGCTVEAFATVKMPIAFTDADFTYSIISIGTIGEILVNDPVQFFDKTLGNVISWEWDFGDGTKSNEQNPQHTYKKPGTYTISLMTFDELGCVSTASIEVEVLASYKIMIPNAFTPNGDGLNDTFIPKMRGIEEFEMHIFNKWGELVYSCFNREDEGWDGKLKGTLSPNGNYVYKIVFRTMDGERGTQTGVFTLVH